jgi:phenylacetate-CoA ligase
LSGYPGSLYFLARRALARGWNVPMRSVVTWGDNLVPHYRRTIEQAFGRRVFDTYGCAEGMQVSAQCGSGPHYHVHMLDVIVEYLDDDNLPVPVGRPGHIVLTRLHPGPMPLIRYRIGDVGTAGTDTVCGCGRQWELMDSIQGRNTDVVVTPSGNRLIVHFFTGILEHFREIEAFQVEQNELDSIDLRIVPTPEFDGEVAESVRLRLSEKGAADLKIHIEPVSNIPIPPSGKHKFVISKVSVDR